MRPENYSIETYVQILEYARTEKLKLSPLEAAVLTLAAMIKEKGDAIEMRIDKLGFNSLSPVGPPGTTEFIGMELRDMREGFTELNSNLSQLVEKIGELIEKREEDA